MTCGLVRSENLCDSLTDPKWSLSIEVELDYDAGVEDVLNDYVGQ